MNRLVYIASRIDSESFARIDRDATVIVLSDAPLSALAPEDLIQRRSFVFAAARDPHVAAFYADYFALSGDATLDLSRVAFADVITAAIWRAPDRARTILLEQQFSARRAFELGLCDALIPREIDPLEWAREWLGTRSAIALQSAASLIRRRGGDALERAEFARLFATNEPQRGLAMFLQKEPLDFSAQIVVEQI